MHKHLKQENAYGCGLYALANVFHDESFITKERLEISKNGNHTGQLNKWMLEDGRELYLEPFYFNANGNKLPKWACSLKPSGGDIISMFFLIDVQYYKNGKTHYISAEISTDGVMTVMDSLLDSTYITTLSDFNKNTYRVFGLWYLRPYEGEGYFVRYE